MHKISFSLGDVDSGIRQLQEYERKFTENLKDFLSKILETGVEISTAKIISLDAVESGDLDKSMDFAVLVKGHEGIIFSNSPYACYVEFGTGIKGRSSPHPTHSWNYDINEHGEEGWYYFDTDLGKLRWTKGMPSRPFMYETARELEKVIPNIAKEVFSH